MVPSLLASFALMLLHDLTGGRHIRRCDACGHVFAAAAYQKRYCSDTCRERLNKQRYRAKLRKPTRKQQQQPKKTAKKKTGRHTKKRKTRSS